MPLLRRRAMMMGHKNRRPSLRSNLAGWITTDFTVTENMTIEYEVYDYRRGFYSCLCGTNTNMLNIESPNSNDDHRVFANIRTSVRNRIYVIDPQEESTHIKIDISNGTVYKDQIEVCKVSVEDGIEASPLTFFRNPNTTRTSDIRLYYFNFYEDGTLIHSIIPYLDDNSVACLRDDITGKIYYNENNDSTTEFLYEEV